MSLENEKFLDELVASGRFASREAILDHAVGMLRQELQQNGNKLSDALTAQEWCDRFEQWADNHKVLPCEVDDSRESIYAGRGE